MKSGRPVVRFSHLIQTTQSKVLTYFNDASYYSERSNSQQEFQEKLWISGREIAMWWYSQSQGTISHNGQAAGQGYSGNGVACNRPEFEHQRFVGPIPRGMYRIGHALTTSKGKCTMALSPVGHNARGRTNFLIHGDSRDCPGSASEGCIVLPLDIRKRIADSGDISLMVTW